MIGVDKSIKKDVSSNLSKINDITEFLISFENFKKTFNVEKQIFRFNRTKHFYTIFEKEIIHDFTKNSILFIENNIYYKYNNLSNDYFRLQHEYNIYDNENNLIYRYLFNKDTYYDKTLDSILLTADNFCIYFKKDYNKIKVVLLLHRHNRHGLGNIDLEIDDDSINYINTNYFDKNNEDIEKNKNDISSNLEQIDTNKDDIASNLGKIGTNTTSISSNLGIINNITKTIMLKNIYFTDFNSKRNEALVRELLYFDNTVNTFNKPNGIEIHDANMEYYFKKGDFIEIDCKLMFSHNTYEYANIIYLYYSLYDGIQSESKLLFREIHRYNQFPLIINKNRVIIYTKLCYKVKYDINKIIFSVATSVSNKKIKLFLYHYIIQNGLNYLSIKHYGKS